MADLLLKHNSQRMVTLLDAISLLSFKVARRVSFQGPHKGFNLIMYKENKVLEARPSGHRGGAKAREKCRDQQDCWELVAM